MRRPRFRTRARMEALLARLVTKGWTITRIPFAHGNPDRTTPEKGPVVPLIRL